MHTWFLVQGYACSLLNVSEGRGMIKTNGEVYFLLFQTVFIKILDYFIKWKVHGSISDSFWEA